MFIYELDPEEVVLEMLIVVLAEDMGTTPHK